MRASAEINQIAAPIGRGQTIFGYFALNELHLEGVVSKHLQCLCLG